MTLRRLLLILAAIGVGTWPIGAGHPWSELQAQTQTPPPAQGRQGGAPQAGRGGGAFVAAPARRAGEGLGPFKRLVVRNVMVIDGTGAPPIGPMNVIVEGNRILQIQGAGTPGVPQRQGGAGPQADHVIDGTGMYLMPGFVDLHVHAGGPPKNAEAEYAYKLWMAHGVTGSPKAPSPVADRRRRASRCTSPGWAPGGHGLLPAARVHCPGPDALMTCKSSSGASRRA